jgi:putative membrane protein
MLTRENPLTGTSNNQPQDERKASLSDYLAAERTFLAWIRTGLSLMGFGFVVARFGLFLQEFQQLRGGSFKESLGLSIWFGTTLILLGVFVNVFAGWHHARLIRDLDRGEVSRSRSTYAIGIAIFLAVVGLAMAVYLLRLWSPGSAL